MLNTNDSHKNTIKDNKRAMMGVDLEVEFSSESPIKEELAGEMVPSLVLSKIGLKLNMT